MSDGMNACNPLQRQVGGSHYLNMKIQPWDIIDSLGLDFYEGTALAYLLRWKDKGGVQDLEKAIHTLERKIAIERLNANGETNETKSHKEAGRFVGKTGETKCKI